MIYVDVCGAVANPGVFQLAAGSRVFQAIEAAGGYLPEAALTCVNRAGVLTDGQQLYILTQEEMERQGLDPAEMSGASDGQLKVDLKNAAALPDLVCTLYRVDGDKDVALASGTRADGRNEW